MAKKNDKRGKPGKGKTLPAETKRAIVVVLLIVVGLFLTLAAFGVAGVAGTNVYEFFAYLVGVGYFLLPSLLFVLAIGALKEDTVGFSVIKVIASFIFILAGLGYIEIVWSKGGLVGAALAHPTVVLFDVYASLILLGGLSLISLLVLLEGKISVELFTLIGRAFMAGPRAIFGLYKKPEDSTMLEPVINGAPTVPDAPTEDEEEAPTPGRTSPEPARALAAATLRDAQAHNSANSLKAMLGQYTPPPLSLLERDKGRPGVGDIKANANIIKRTLANFGIVVELDEISIGPSVTRYAIKPAEGVRLQKIVGLQTNLELALAAHPVRIEAPIPGKSLVGIEVPNSAKVTVGLGTLLEGKEFTDSPKPRGSRSAQRCWRPPC